MEKILKALWILQEVSNKDRNPKLGRGFMTARRMNPYNPLSYIYLIGGIIVALLYEFFKVFKELTFSNPFKWD